MKLLIVSVCLLGLAACGEPTEEQRRAQYRAELADAVKSGDMSFEQAGCEFRGGEWSFEREVCVIDPPIYTH